MSKVLQLSSEKILSCMSSLTPKSSKVLLLLSALSDNDDLVEVIPHLTAKKFGITKATLVAGITELKKLGLIRTISPSKNGLGHVYRISSNDEDIVNEIMEKLF